MKQLLKTKQQEKVTLFYNKVVPKYNIDFLSLEPLGGILGSSRSKHLLSRCLFGFSQTNLDSIKDKTVAQVVNLLLEEKDLPSPPLGVDSRDEDTPIGETWIDKPYVSSYNRYRNHSLHSWWMGQILNHEISLREKMVLFWHNHFVTERSVVSRADFLYQYNDCLRRNALGNFQKLTEEITVLPAMLRYLNGEYNIANAPNENYARELLELFTIGKGLLITEGNYTFFTEQDVVAAAKVLTGWKINYTAGMSSFNATKHDTSSKIFSESFAQTTIINEGENEYKSLIQLILDQEETARFIVRKIYRWFVYYAIDDEIELNIIEPLAAIFRINNYNIKPVLSALLNSQHFYDENLRGSLIKNPIDFIAGSIKHLQFPIPGKEQLLVMYDLWNYQNNQSIYQEMKIGEPTDVAGWQAYYLAPRYYQLWINATTLPYKTKFTNTLTSKNGIKSNGVYYRSNLLALAKSVSNPSDINILISELASRFFPFGATEEQIVNLKEVLIPGLPDFEWTYEWNSYLLNPEDENQKTTIESKLRNLVQIMFRMAEYQLS